MKFYEHTYLLGFSKLDLTRNDSKINWSDMSQKNLSRHESGRVWVDLIQPV
jgi:hypothetical protein